MANKMTPKPRKDIRGGENYAMLPEDETKLTPICRLREFVRWAILNGLSKSETDFERQCSLSPKYLANNANTGKGNIGTEILGRIIRVYPQLNLAWLCTGLGGMVLRQPGDLNADFKQAYDGAMIQIDALNRIIKTLDLGLKNDGAMT